MSSGVKISSGVRFSIRNPPPLMAFMSLALPVMRFFSVRSASIREMLALEPLCGFAKEIWDSYLAEGCRVDTHVKRACRSNQGFRPLLVDFKVEYQAGVSEAGDSGIHLEYVVEPRRRFELHRCPCKDRIDSALDKIGVCESKLSEVLRPGYIVVSKIVAIKHDPLKISVRKPHANIVVKSEVRAHRDLNNAARH